uniref:Putative secreted protein n=1 Tax=Ixodes ricinus TaxID=34613 RepID=V5H025_IXORI
MEVKIFTLLQIALFIALGIHLIVAGPETKEDSESDVFRTYFTVRILRRELHTASQMEAGPHALEKNGTCRCYHESGKTVGLCLSTEYTDFSEYPDPNSSEIIAATPLPPEEIFIQ